MALIITPGSASSDSYASVEEADEWLINSGRFYWDEELSLDDKEIRLRRATQWIDATFWRRFPGSQLNGRNQSLQWPRKNVLDDRGVLIDQNTIPPEVVRATIEAAVVDPEELEEKQPLLKRRRERVGPIEEEYEYSAPAQADTIQARLEGILWPILIKGIGSANWIMRA